MISSTPRARWAGALLLLQLAGLIVPFILLHPLVPSDFLATAAARAVQLKVATDLLLLNGLVTVAIAAVLWPMVHEATEVGGLLLLLAGALMFVLQAVDNAHLLTMLSLSKQYVAAGTPRDMLELLGANARTTRLGVHYAELLSIDLWMWTLYGVLLRARVVPPTLAGVGLIFTTLHCIGVVLPYYLSYPGIQSLAPLMGLSQLALVGRLMITGFNAPVTARDSRLGR